MKKTYVEFADDGKITAHALLSGKESFALYAGIDAVYGGWVLTSNGDPCTLNELENADSEEMIQSVNALLADPEIWEPCDDEDEAYISEWLGIWGIA